MTLEEAFNLFHERYGSHSAAADALSINRSYYRAIRNGRSKPSDKLQELLIIKAFEQAKTQHGQLQDVDA